MDLIGSDVSEYRSYHRVLSATNSCLSVVLMVIPDPEAV